MIFFTTVYIHVLKVKIEGYQWCKMRTFLNTLVTCGVPVEPISGSGCFSDLKPSTVVTDGEIDTSFDK